MLLMVFLTSCEDWWSSFFLAAIWSFMSNDIQTFNTHTIPHPPFLFLPDEAGYIHVREGGHQILTVESIHDTTVAGDGVGKVLQERRDQGIMTSKHRYMLSVGLTGVRPVYG